MVHPSRCGAPASVGGSSSSAGSGAAKPPVKEAPPGILVTHSGDGRRKKVESAGCQEKAERHVHFSEEEPDYDDPEEEPEGPVGQAYLEHLLTHKPADTAHCETCMRAKSRNVKKFIGNPKSLLFSRSAVVVASGFDLFNSLKI